MDQPPKPTEKGSKLKSLLAEYGRLAIVVYLGIFLIVFLGAAAGIQLGFEFDGAAADVGTIAAAWLVTKVTQPIRIIATVALTPILAAVLGRKKREPDP